MTHHLAHHDTADYDWDLRAPTVQTVDPARLALTTRTSYDSQGQDAMGRQHQQYLFMSSRPMTR